jgi:uncharacterized DUF497 family protein
MDFSAFDWDEGNREKCQKHGVSRSAIESMFTGAGVAILPDAAHSQQEQRFRAIGRTRAGRTIFVVFTLRHIGGAMLIRPISARYLHNTEVRAYEKDNPDVSER